MDLYRNWICGMQGQSGWCYVRTAGAGAAAKNTDVIAQVNEG